LAALALGGLGFYFGVHLPERRRAQAALLESQLQVAEALRVANGRELAKAEAARVAAARGGLVVRTQPAAEVRVGSIARGQSPLSLKDQRLGKYPLQVRLAGYEEWSGEAEVRENQVTEVEVALKPSTGSLEVSSEPAGLAVEVVSVRLAGTGLAAVRRSARTPASLAGLPVGEYEVTLRREGWPEARRRVTVERGGNASARAEFTSGSQRVTAEPAAVEAHETGRRREETPLARSEQAPGRAAPNVDPGLWTIPDPKLELRRIPAGSFRMGSAGGDTDERPVTEVTLRQFWLGRTEVTQAQWQALMGGNPSGRKGDNLPVTRVSWDEVLEFCRQLTERERVAGRLPPGFAYTLPTEAQWEYACRAGTSGDYAGSLSEFGWYAPNSSRQTQPVGTKRANLWGLHDMHGNVFEWCLDWYEDRLPGQVVEDPTGPRTGANRVVRGGAWNSDPELCRSSSRNSNPPAARADVLGFRVALSSIPASRESK
jgi:formylglycine-generating enzyme required for sulfatase activity